MKTSKLYTLDAPMVQELNRKKPRGRRSAFVNAAIKARLSGEENFDVGHVSTSKLAAVLMTRIQIENKWEHTPLSLMLKELAK